MNLDTAQTADREARLGDILAAWLEAVESGQSPDRAAWLARHPEFAAELTEFFADHDELHAVAAPLRDVAQAAATPQTPGLGNHRPRLTPEASSFGDYELLEVLGQGGMGIVYKARQKSLSRLVALKMIRADRLASTEQVRRIRNEAEAVAALDHPGVVPIYEVGECAGQPFFTMKLLEGGSLASGMANGSKVVVPQLVAGAEVLRSPGLGAPGLRSTSAPATLFTTQPRTAARLLAQVALAVHHAHQRGILHRDLKPSNILLDAEGRPHVADFGLAKWLTGDSSLTGTGAVVGTPSYAAPEQASANPRQLTTAADVYGLGAILYALLTGRPPFQGETPLHTLDLLRQEEPVAPRRLNRAIPADLETIVAKAMDKNPEARYGTAKEMAEDLERFLKDEPIRAQRPTLVQRIAKWARRHKAIAGMGVATLALTTILSLASAVIIWREKEQTQAALDDAELNRLHAEANFRKAFWAIENILGALDPKRNPEPVTSKLREYQTEMALSFLAPFCEDQSDRPAERLQKGAALVHRGRVYQVLGEWEKSQHAFQRAITVFQQLVEDFPSHPTYPNELGVALFILAEDTYDVGRIQDANNYFRKAIAIFRDAVRKHPSELRAYIWLGRSLANWRDPQLREPMGAMTALRRAVELAPDYLNARELLAIAYYRCGQGDLAIRTARETLNLSDGQRQLVFGKACLDDFAAAAKGAGEGGFSPNRANLVLAMALWNGGNHKQAKDAYEQAVRRGTFVWTDSFDLALRDEAATLLGINGGNKHPE